MRTGYEEAFIEELKGFWSAIVEGKDVRNTLNSAPRYEASLRFAQFHAGAVYESAHWHQSDYLEQ